MSAFANNLSFLVWYTSNYFYVFLKGGNITYYNTDIMTKSKKRIAPYIMDKEKCLGKGGFSEVYLCEH